MALRYSTSSYIGDTTRGLSTNVFWDAHTSIFNIGSPTAVVTGNPGSGKALSVKTKVHTTRGLVPLYDIKIGDRVLSRDGKYYPVLYKSPIKKNIEYRIFFSDGQTLDTCRDHQFTVSSPYQVLDSLFDSATIRRDAFYLANAYSRLKESGTEFLTISEISERLTKLGVETVSAKDMRETTLMKGLAIPFRAETVNNALQLRYDYNATVINLSHYLREKSILVDRNETVLTVGEILSYGVVDENKAPVFYINEVDPSKGVNTLRDKSIDHYRDTIDDLVYTLPLTVRERVASEALGCHRIDLYKPASRYVDRSEFGVERITYIANVIRSLGVQVSVFTVDDATYRLDINTSTHYNSGFKWITKIERLHSKTSGVCITVDSPDHTYVTEGFIATHNTFFLLTISCQNILCGHVTIVLDPKGDFLPLINLEDELGPMNVWNLTAEQYRGVIDPFRLTSDKNEQIELALNAISMFIGELSDSQIQVVAPILQDLVDKEDPTMTDLLSELVMSEEVIARQLGVQLGLIANLKQSASCFADETTIPTNIDINSGTTIIAMPGLELPGKDTNKMSNKQRLASAVFFLVTNFIYRVMYESNETTTKTVIIDEAWVILKTTAGSDLIMALTLLGRSKNLAIILVSQTLSHFKNKESGSEGTSIDNSIGTRFAFRAAEDDATDVVRSMRLPPNSGFEQVLCDLSIGECLMSDYQGNYATVQITSFNEKWKENFETNPWEKMNRERKHKKQNSGSSE